MATAKANITGQLRSEILSGQWTPGVKLQPAALATALGVSGTVVREALTSLIGSGLVVAQRNRGFFVRSLDLAELTDMTELRCRTEALGIEWSVERGDLAWETRVITAHHLLASTPRRDRRDSRRVDLDWQRLHKDFHLAVIDGCGSESLMTVASNLFDATELYRCWAAQHVSPSSRDVEGEHQRILDALLDRDAPRATQALREHYEATINIIAEHGLAPESLAAGTGPTVRA